jgi:hypothetical protein
MSLPCPTIRSGTETAIANQDRPYTGTEILSIVERLHPDRLPSGTMTMLRASASFLVLLLMIVFLLGWGCARKEPL